MNRNLRNAGISALVALGSGFGTYFSFDKSLTPSEAYKTSSAALDESIVAMKGNRFQSNFSLDCEAALYHLGKVDNSYKGISFESARSRLEGLSFREDKSLNESDAFLKKSTRESVVNELNHAKESASFKEGARANRWNVAGFLLGVATVGSGIVSGNYLVNYRRERKEKKNETQ